LSFEQELLEIEITNIKLELTKLFLHEGYIAGEAKCKKYLNEYPNSIQLKVAVAGLLNMYLMMSENNSEEFIKTKRQNMNY
jgi:ribosomal protein S8